ncbi:hypothetical protein DRQ07_01700 [candidate division KSB1 bacterium]|nr:MAG: hypothetical protein DRQ07_01700 [candidate division KSB1 bacterium]
MENNTTFIDQDIIYNPGRSKIFKYIIIVFFSVSLLGYFFIVIDFALSKKILSVLVFAVYGLILVGLTLKRVYVYKKYGRKYIKIIGGNLEIKQSYKNSAIQIRNDQIKNISFSSNTFVLKLQNNEKIEFKTPIDVYLDLRKKLTDFANEYDINC